MAFKNLSAMHRATAERLGPRVELRFKRDGLYHDLSWTACRRRADHAAAGLIDRGIKIGDRVGILANGVLVREGPLDELLGLKNQTELVFENANAETLDAVERLAISSGARVLERRRPQTSLERLFLEATGELSDTPDSK